MVLLDPLSPLSDIIVIYTFNAWAEPKLSLSCQCINPLNHISSNATDSCKIPVYEL